MKIIGYLDSLILFFLMGGSIYLNLKSSQIFITASQKERYLLDIISNIYGGVVSTEKPSNSFKWLVYRKADIVKILDYFKISPCRSNKQNRLNAVCTYLNLREFKAHLSPEDSKLGLEWKNFLLNWKE